MEVRMGDLADRISEWIAASVRDAGMKGAVVGLSGGIDSAVTAALCKRALGGNVLCVIMPCESCRRDEEDAQAVAAALGLGAVTVRLDGVYKALADALPEATPMARANLKPRLRMATLYAYANSLGYMVVGTGNKTELAVGYFTKHGDGGVDLLPIGDLSKMQVRGLARELGVPQRVIEKPPSAGLWEGQTDEEELGIGYTELDRALVAIETGNTECVAPETLGRVRVMAERAAHKRAGPRLFEVTQ
jgi:NAD+ synthase